MAGVWTSAVYSKSPQNKFPLKKMKMETKHQEQTNQKVCLSFNNFIKFVFSSYSTVYIYIGNA